jgi:hypothetical protein
MHETIVIYIAYLPFDRKQEVIGSAKVISTVRFLSVKSLLNKHVN